MAVQDYKINYKSDFVLNINGDAGWAVPFCIKFWTGMPSQAYFVGFDGVKYVNCRVGDTPTQLLVMFDDHHLPIGPLKMQIAYHTTIEEFPGSVFDEVTNARDVIVTIDGTDYQVMLDFTGEDAPELEFDLPAYANEAERIQNELQRQQNEADRIAAELQREQTTAAAVQGADNVNAQLSGNILTVTNRQGVSTSVNTKGERGVPGPVGPEGPQGEQGVSIVDFSPKSQTATTLIYTATFSDGHTQDVAIPKGSKGDTGATGPTGPQGPQGETGVSITGLVKTGETETDTLYNVTFSNGTTQQVSIPKGEKGDQGPVGPQGPQGPMGDVAVITPEQQAAFTMYSVPGQNTDGPMTQKAVTDALVAGSISYDNSQSGLAATNVQGALDEINNTGYVDAHKLLFSNSISYVINMSGNWTGSKSSHYLVDVRDIDAVRITANNNNDCTYYWLTSNTAPANQDPAPISTINGNRYTIPAGQTAIGIVPTDAQYLYLMGTINSLDHKPTQVIAAFNFNSVAESNEEIESVVWNDISRNARYANVIVDNSGNESASTTRATTMLINAVNGIRIVANEGYAIKAICYYNNDGVFVSRDWFASSFVNENVKYNGFVRFIVSKEDNANIALVDDYSNFTITSKEYNAENNAKLSQVGFVEVNPYTQPGKIVNFAGVIETTRATDRHLLWYPMKQGDTIHITLGGASNRCVAFYAALNPSVAVLSELRVTQVYTNESVDMYYTAEEDGFICLTFLDGANTSYSFAINHEDDADFDSTVVPKIACGTKIVSRLEDTYCHAPMIHETTKYRFICYHGSNKVTQENTNDVTYVVLLVIDKTNGRSKYINVYDTAKPDYIDGNKCTVYYNQSIIGIGSTNTLMIRVGCQCNGKWIEIYKTYNADTGVLSAAAMQKLSYNGNTYDFNLANYITMVNTLYNKSFTVVQLRVTNEITSMCYYNNKYYCVMAYFCHDKLAIPARFIKCPHIFAVSDDAITWTPIANVTDDYYSAETLLTIVNDIVYHVFRSDRLGEFYMVFDMQGNVLKAPEPTNNPLSKVWSKPAIAYSGGRVLIGFNKVYDDGVSSDIYSLRTKMCLAEISQTAPYGLTEYKTYVSANGWNYYYFAPKKNGNLLIVNVEDSRGLNDNIHQVVTDVNICEVDMLELTSNE